MTKRMVPIVYDGRTVHVEYRPEAIPLDEGRGLDRRMHEAIEEDDRRALHRQVLLRILVGWDLTGPDGERLPISSAVFDHHVSWFFERLIMQSIIRHRQRGRPRHRLCAACGRALSDEEPVYVERFVMNGRSKAPGPVGAECASPEFLDDTQGQEPEHCIGCERPMYYRSVDPRRQRALCSTRCANRVGKAQRRKAGA